MSTSEGLPPFSGDSSDRRTVGEWCHIVDKVAEEGAWSSRLTAALALEALRGPAAVWSRVAMIEEPEDIVFWGRLRQLLCLRFTPAPVTLPSPEEQAAARATLRRLRPAQRIDESVTEFFDRAERQFHEVLDSSYEGESEATVRGMMACNNHMLRVAFIQGLNPDIREGIMLLNEQRHLSLSTLRHRAMEMELAIEREQEEDHATYDLMADMQTLQFRRSLSPSPTGEATSQESLDRSPSPMLPDGPNA